MSSEAEAVKSLQFTLPVSHHSRDGADESMTRAFED